MKRLFVLLSVVPVLFLGAFVAGCGGDDSSDSGGENTTQSSNQETTDLVRVAEKVGRYSSNNNVKGFCSLFAPGKFEEWIPEGNCEKVFASGFDPSLDPSQFEIEGIDVDGDQATVSYGYGDVDFIKVDGDWYLDTPDIDPGAGAEES